LDTATVAKEELPSPKSCGLRSSQEGRTTLVFPLSPFLLCGHDESLCKLIYEERGFVGKSSGRTMFDKRKLRRKK
jgi:hypothetical protein